MASAHVGQIACHARSERTCEVSEIMPSFVPPLPLPHLPPQEEGEEDEDKEEEEEDEDKEEEEEEEEEEKF